MSRAEQIGSTLEIATCAVAPVAGLPTRNRFCSISCALMTSKADTDPDGEAIGIGSVIGGRYRLDAVLGQGGMGCVYLAEHTGIGRAVAVKILKADLGGSQDAARRFKREALASGRLDHPNIVGVSDFGVLDDGSCYLVMDALQGESLGARIDRDGPLPWSDALDVMRGILRGLKHAHDRGVVHRDIKPDNIFLASQDGRHVVVKLLDFGIAKLVAGADEDPASTRAGMTMGTPAYLSPEQAVGGEITARTDLYSATVVLFEMLTGRAPFDDPDLVAVMIAHVSRPAPSLAETAPGLDLPPQLEAVIEHGLQKFTAARIASAGDYLELLDSIFAPFEAALPGAAAGFTPYTPEAFPSPSFAYAPTPFPALQSQPLLAPAPVERARSLAEHSDPMPRTWLIGGGLAFGGAVLLAAIMALASGDEPNKTAARPDAGPRTDPIEDVGSAATVPTSPIETTDDVFEQPDRQVALKALLHDLSSGKTCADRRAVIPKLVELGDPAAIPSLKAARYRMRGGLLGVGSSNSNACLKKTAEAAIKALTK